MLVNLQPRGYARLLTICYRHFAFTLFVETALPHYSIGHACMPEGADSSVSKVSDSGSDGPGFDSQPSLKLFVQPLASCFALMCTQSAQLQMSTDISSGNNTSG